MSKVTIRTDGFENSEVKLFSTDELVPAKDPNWWSGYRRSRTGYFLGRLTTGSRTETDIAACPVRLYAVTYNSIVDVEHPRSTWSTGSSPVWQIIRWVDLNIEVLGESKPDTTVGEVQ
jgi:hypothetical protein